MAMPTDTHILTLAQWFSPGFPVGAFAYSHGLEWAIQMGHIRDATTLEIWLGNILEHGAGRSDVIFLAHAYRSEDGDITDLDALLRAYAPSRERLLESVQQGEAFARTVSDISEFTATPASYPVAVGHAAKLAELPLELTAKTYLQAFIANLISAAVRLVPLGQTDGQRCLRHLAPQIEIVASQAITAGLDDVSSTAFLADIAGMNQAAMHTRIFRS